MGVSGVIGPLLGGAFTSNVSWRWCFYSKSLQLEISSPGPANLLTLVNLPIGGFALLVIFFILQPFPPVKPDMPIVERLKNLDLLGEFFIIPSIVSLLLALQWGGTMYAWSNGRIIVLFVVFGLCAIAFVAVEVLTQKTATISARIIKNRSIIAGK
jgi:MFS family permease